MVAKDKSSISVTDTHRDRILKDSRYTNNTKGTELTGRSISTRGILKNKSKERENVVILSNNTVLSGQQDITQEDTTN